MTKFFCSSNQHYLPLDRLLVHEASGASRAEVTESSDVTETDDDESTNGGAKSRRKNSKFLEREQRQAPTSSTTTATTKSATSSSNLTATDNEDDTFEKLATEPSTTKMVNYVFNTKRTNLNEFLVPQNDCAFFHGLFRTFSLSLRS